MEGEEKKEKQQRQRGPGRNKKFLMSRLQDMYGEEFHPIMRMAENADKLQKAADIENDPASFKAAVDGWDRIAKYVEPQLKAVDISADVAVTAVDMSGWSEDQLDDFIKQNAKNG